MATKTTSNSATGKCGKHKPKKDARTLKVSKYLNKQTQAPASCDWTRKVTKPWGIMDNNTLCDCTCAAAAHMIKCWAANAGRKAVALSNSTIVGVYSAITGYVRGNPITDKGARELTVLKYWRAAGIGGHKILAYAEVSSKNHNHVKQSLYLFGGLYIGLNLPQSINGQKIWDVPKGGLIGDGQPGTLGGHAVTALGYDAKTITVVTKGNAVKMTWAFWDAYCDEAYAIISPDFFKNGETPTGINIEKLEQDLLNITGEKITLRNQLAVGKNGKTTQPMFINKTVKKAGKAAVKTNAFTALSKPAQRALANAHITSLKDLSKLTEKEFLALHGVGKASLPILKKMMEDKGLGWRK